MHTQTARAAATMAGFLLVLATSTGALASIENEPVKVTRKNSGPKYDVSVEVEKTLMGSDNDQSINQVLPPRPPMPQEPSAANGENSDNDSPIGHLSIRRIFLVPMRPTFSSREDMPEPQQQQPGSDSKEPRLPANLWPLFTMAPQPHHQHHPHLFGQDEASRPPMVANEEPIASSPSAEREHQQPQGALLDPIQMLMDMMQQATAHLGNAFLTDLNREATSNNNGSKPVESQQDTSLEKPQIPMGRHNETKEEIVEIEGRKYLRKVVINRHVGDNLIFMTKRLIFVPLNETESTTTTTTTTEAPAASTNGSVERETEPLSRKPDQELASSTTTTSTTTAAPEEAKSEATSTATEQTTTTTTASTQEAASPSNAPSTTPLDKDKEAASTLDVIRRAVNSSS